MKLAVILPTLAGGGMERVHLHLIEEWVRRGIQVDLLLSRLQGELCNMVPKQVSVIELAGPKPYFFPIGLYNYVKNQQPTHILTAGHDINAITLFIVWLCRKQIRVVGTFHNHLSSELKLAKGFKWLKLRVSVLLLRLFLWRSQGIISVSQGVADDLKKHLGTKYNIFHVVYNPVLTTDMLKKINQPLTGLPVPENKQWILYAGRFVYAKGLDILLEAFKLVSDKTTAHLVLMGEGPLKSKIADEFKAANLGNRVHIIEFQINPLPWMREADVLVLPSRREGLGNGIIEAMACGTQIVATDCPSGPPEILDNGKYGQLVPVENPKALGQALLLSLSGDFHIPPLKLQERANFFSSKKAASIYISLLKKDHQKF